MSATRLGATAIKDALEKSKVPASSIDAVYMGNVLSAGVGQAPARQAAIFAGLPTNIEATTINKVCASGLKAVNLAASTIELGQAEAQVAGGMENMTRVPYYLNRASQQPAFGHQKLQDGLIDDGLWDVYNQIHMGNCAESTAKKYDVSRQDQDDYAIETYKRAQKAYKEGLFKEEIVPVTVKTRKGEVLIEEDEQYNKLKLDKVPTLKPAFEKGPNGTVTAANSSPLSDGASALVLGSKAIAQQYGKDSRVLAKIITYADAAVGTSNPFPILTFSYTNIIQTQSTSPSHPPPASRSCSSSPDSRRKTSPSGSSTRPSPQSSKPTPRSWVWVRIMSTREVELLRLVTHWVAQAAGYWLRCCISLRLGSMVLRPFAMVVVRRVALLCRGLVRISYE